MEPELTAATTERDALAAQIENMRGGLTLEAARIIGEIGAPHSDAEHALFREYLRGHCWKDGEWQNDKRSYADAQTRILYAVWRARAALGQPAPQPDVVRPVYDKSVVKRIAAQMGWTPPGCAAA